MSAIAKRMIQVLCAILLALILGSILYYRSLAFLPFALGAFLGTAVSILKVFWFERTIDKLSGMDAGKAAGYIWLQQILRFLVTGGLLVLAAVVPFINLWGAAAGVLSFQIAIFSTKRVYGEGEKTEPSRKVNQDTAPSQDDKPGGE